MIAPIGKDAKSQRIIEMKFAHSDMLSLQEFHRDQERQEQLQQLQQATGVDDAQLLQRLVEAGFNARNIYALNWLPIALVAWVSPGVSTEETQASKLVNLHAVFASNSEATQLFQSWLNEKPREKLMRLWQDLVSRQATSSHAEELSKTGQAIWYVAQRVARASGGMLGIGQISAAEQRILERIRVVYGLKDSQLLD